MEKAIKPPKDDSSMTKSQRFFNGVKAYCSIFVRVIKYAIPPPTITAIAQDIKDIPIEVPSGFQSLKTLCSSVVRKHKKECSKQ